MIARFWVLGTYAGMALCVGSMSVLVAACEAGVVASFLDFAVLAVVGAVVMAVSAEMSR